MRLGGTEIPRYIRICRGNAAPCFLGRSQHLDGRTTLEMPTFQTYLVFHDLGQGALELHPLQQDLT
jgi:hypothetical protein